MAVRATYTVEQFVEDLRRILETEGEGYEAVWSIGPLMQRLAQEGGDLWQQGESRTGTAGMGGRLLHRDPENKFVLFVSQFPPHGVTPVHSHEGWGVICLLSGSERYTSWRRVDDGARQGEAKLVVVQDHHMQPGDLAYWFKAPYNLHRQWPGAEGCSEIVLLAGSGQRVHHFDLDHGTWEDAPRR